MNGSLSGGAIVYGVGNLHGGGVELVAALEALAVDPEGDPDRDPDAETVTDEPDPLDRRGVA
jgi:hypothetical protein